MKIYRQGDVLLQQIDKLPVGLKKIESGVILRGESTGHKHQLVNGSLFKDSEGLMFLSIVSNGQIVHEEHNTINLPNGKYAVVRQREYQSKDMVRVVVD